MPHRSWIAGPACCWAAAAARAAASTAAAGSTGCWSPPVAAASRRWPRSAGRISRTPRHTGCPCTGQGRSPADPGPLPHPPAQQGCVIRNLSGQSRYGALLSTLTWGWRCGSSSSPGRPGVRSLQRQSLQRPRATLPATRLSSGLGSYQLEARLAVIGQVRRRRRGALELVAAVRALH